MGDGTPAEGRVVELLVAYAAYLSPMLEDVTREDAERNLTFPPSPPRVRPRRSCLRELVSCAGDHVSSKERASKPVLCLASAVVVVMFGVVSANASDGLRKHGRRR